MTQKNELQIVNVQKVVAEANQARAIYLANLIRSLFVRTPVVNTAAKAA